MSLAFVGNGAEFYERAVLNIHTQCVIMVELQAWIVCQPPPSLQPKLSSMDGVDTESAHGPLFLGYLFNTILLGIVMTQMYIYHTTFKRDNIWTKIAVVALLVANVLNTTFITAYLYQALILFFGSPAQSVRMNWLSVSEPFLTTLIILGAQGFFAWRTFALSKRWIYPVLVMIPAFASAAGGLLTGVSFVRRPAFSDLRKSTPFIMLWLVAGVVCDALIVGIRLWHIVRRKRPPQRASKPELLTDRLIRVLLGSGILTLALATTDLIVYLAFNGTGKHLILNLSLCKLFSSNVMHCLNSRHGKKVRWSSELVPHTLYDSQDVRPGDVIEFMKIRTAASDASQTQYDQYEDESHKEENGEDFESYP